MIKLESLSPGQKLLGLLPNQPVTIVDVRWHGFDAVELFYTRPDGTTGSQLLYRDQEPALDLAERDEAWRFSEDGDSFRLTAEAYRIHLAHLFDPVLAVHTSLIEPLPHQITAVYGDMLPRQPLRFLLADDPGAGKTIMAGLLIKELMVRGDVERCLICAPGSLATQWQDELWFKFHLRFDILTRESAEMAPGGNVFADAERLIIRLDQLSRNEDLQEKLSRTNWDLVIIDEAHKMSASVWGNEVKYTRRYRLGELLGDISRHLLLMTATPHNGKEEDFQLFMSLLDPDRFESSTSESFQPVDVTDMMRRMVKEDLRRFDGRPLFPERLAYTVNYKLSPEEDALYQAVTQYVQKEFNRADQLNRDDKRRNNVGFALTVLQRRLASSPEAIYKSLMRRRERLEKRLKDTVAFVEQAPDVDEDFLDDLPAEELESLEELVIDSATTAGTVAELDAEIDTLRKLESMAFQLRQSGRDQKWQQLATLLQDNEHMVDPSGIRRKLVIFTEHRDTLRYLRDRITTLFGHDESLVIIDGSLRREDRRAAEDKFRNDPSTHFLLATDAAGEGINLQRANLMINYDLPWNPNRLEQRFGRIHRIGQAEVCHLWNLVAEETREGHVYARLLRKLETERKALDGRVFDVLGALFDQTPLRQLLIEAVRYGDLPETRAKLDQAIDGAVDKDHVLSLIEARSLAAQTMDLSQIEAIRADMERYAARRLQPHHIRSFFLEAFGRLGGTISEPEKGRYRVGYVPAALRERAKIMGTARPVQRQYERICFEKGLINPTGKPLADFICPGHPLLDAVIDLVLSQQSELLADGAVLVDETDPGTAPRVLFFLEQTIRDAANRPISQEVHFVEIDPEGNVSGGGGAPYLDYSPMSQVKGLDTRERTALDGTLADFSGRAAEMESQTKGYAIANLVPRHLQRVRELREARIDKTMAAVQERLTREINYWDRRAIELRQQERAGRPNNKLNAAQAAKRADELSERLERRKHELAQERQIAATPPVIIGRALIIPIGLLLGPRTPVDLTDRRVTEMIGMHAVMEREIEIGCHPSDVSDQDRGYDIESFDPRTGRLRFIEVKGRRVGAPTVTLTRNELLAAVNSPDQFILAIVEVDGDQPHPPRYVQRFTTREPDFAVTSVNFNLAELLAVAEQS